MADPQPSALQFDKAEVEGPGASTCAVCGKALVGSYFTINGQPTCGTCRDQLEAHFAGAGGSGVARFARAALFGLVGGLGGTVVWYIVEHAFSLQIGLVAILIGWLAGSGVSRGSGGVGGLPYQFLAVGLTYVCICFAWVPDIAKELGQPRGERAVKVSPLHPKGEAPTLPEGSEAKAAGGEAKAEARAPGPEGELVGEALPAAPGGEPESLVLPGLLRWPVAMVFSLGLPFMGALGPIGLLIAAFGLWEAWRRNRKVVLAISGPFALSPGAPAPAPAGPATAAGVDPNVPG